jgi:hypothetical protein
MRTVKKKSFLISSFLFILKMEQKSGIPFLLYTFPASFNLSKEVVQDSLHGLRHYKNDKALLLKKTVKHSTVDTYYFNFKILFQL